LVYTEARVENRIKERLTGALILVAALVILVPEIFSGRHASEPSKDAPPAAPASEGPPLRTYTADLQAPATQPLAQSPSTQAAPEEQPVEPSATLPEPAPSRPAPPPEPARTETPQPSAAPAPAPKPAPPPQPRVADAPSSAGNWYVQVGSFGKVENAQRYAQQLRSEGYSVSVGAPVGSKALSPVRVGPARTREAAAALQQKLAAAGHKGAVVGS
jgi:DedD protein